jgi:hypothetical protein
VESIKLAFTPNQDGYLYVINKQEGSSGQIIFPLGSKAPEKAIKDEVFYAPACRNRSLTTSFKTLPTPGSCYFKLNQETGDETLVVIFSREPLVDLAKSLAGGQGTISAQVIEQLKATSGQKLQTFAGQKSSLLRGGEDRFAAFVTNTNVNDNEELIDYIVLKHER